MPLTLPLAQATRFHLSLNVSELERSVAFYRILFGQPPAKHYADYAKFELDDPPVVLSLEPAGRGSGGPLSHLGFRMVDSAALVAMQRRLEEAGIRSRREEGVECCYARQTKFWVTDPDQTLWEIYTLEEDLDHRGPGQDLHEMLPEAPAPAAAPVVWEHRLSDPVPATFPQTDGSVDEVRLRGTFNVPQGAGVNERLLGEALRVLRPGGKLFVHVLVAERPLPAAPQLPGPAAVVRHVPLEHEPPRLVQEAGFQGLELVKLDAQPCFVRDGVAMREMQLVGWKPLTPTDEAREAVLYRGPCRQITDDSGTLYIRGERVLIDAATAEQLRGGSLASRFVFFEPNPSRVRQ
jgi:catechol 2,3-dioxygenase-like lactoylglutathione lyase family enzyme